MVVTLSWVASIRTTLLIPTGKSLLWVTDVSWETVEKRNIGLDYAFFNGLIAGSVDVFNDTRTDIIISGDSRAIPSYFGTTAPRTNLGKVNSHGYELELRLNHVFNNGLRAWLNTSMTHAINEIKFRDDAPLLPAYQKGSRTYN